MATSGMFYRALTKTTLLLSVFSAIVMSTASGQAKEKSMKQEQVFKLKQTHIFDEALKVTFQSASVESIAASPTNPAAYPAGSGVNFSFKVEFGSESQAIEFSRLSTGYTSKTQEDWHGYTFELGTSKNETKSDIEVSLSVTKIAAAKAQTLGSTWAIVFDDFSAFHLDGKYLNVQSDGHFFLHTLGRGNNGPEEKIFKGILSKSLLAAIDSLDLSKIESPPEKTLLPDEVVAKLSLATLVKEKPLTKDVRFRMGSPLDPLNPEATRLLHVAQTLIKEIEKSKPAVHHAKVQSPTSRRKVPKEQALKLALRNGFLATWTQVQLHDIYWVISGYSKSANPAMLAVVSAFDGSIVASTDNSGMNPIGASFRLIKPSESYDVENIEANPVWKRQPL